MKREKKYSLLCKDITAGMPVSAGDGWSFFIKPEFRDTITIVHTALYYKN